MNNIDKFNRCTAEILALLYSKFPLRLSIFDAKEWVNNQMPIKPYDEPFVYEVVEFLNDEGFISYKQASKANLCFIGLRLSLKGLSLLNKTPDELKERKSYGESIGEMVDKSSWLAASELVKQAIARLF